MQGNCERIISPESIGGDSGLRRYREERNSDGIPEAFAPDHQSAHAVLRIPNPVGTGFEHHESCPFVEMSWNALKLESVSLTST